ncbi:MAG TPA: hypothetical protein VLZ12_01910 [Verrucomicrobiae bacterium]|nr:hypothetical protein [Verrucomicrobiae bacterium]
MADEQPQQPAPAEESKKDTVRINLPPGLTGRTSAPPPAGAPPAKLKPTGPPGTPDDEAKKETAVMGMPVAAPKPKKDTSRVQVSAAKPAVPEAPRPTVKLKRDEAPAAVPPTVAATTAKAAAAKAPVAAATSAADAGLAVGAILLSIAVLGYLAYLVYG